MSEPRPIIYLRSSMGGRDALWVQERRVRSALESAGVPTALMHVYSDVDSPGDRVGGALGWILREAAMRSVGTVVVQDFSRFGRSADMVLHILEQLEHGGATVLLVGEILRERGLQERLRGALGLPARPCMRPLAATRDSDVWSTAALTASGSV